MLRVRGDDTIVAVSTASGRSGIGIVRISGPLCAFIAAQIVGKVPEPRVAANSVFYDAAGSALDSGLALFFPSPRSYTGEDVLELHGHGNPLLLLGLVQRCRELGARQAEPGEFTQRAFLNDKLDLAQAEGVAELIEARSSAAARSALRSLSGEFSSLIDSLRDQLVEVRIWVEANLDFPEEGIEVEHDAIWERLRGLAQNLENILGSASKGRLLTEGARIVLLGRPNVGKSSLMNALAKGDISIVTEIPGTTRDAVREAILIGDVPAMLIDTAGIRETYEKIEVIGIARSFTELSLADLALVVTEAQHGITPDDLALASRIPADMNQIWIANKVDLVDHLHMSHSVSGKVTVEVSAKSGAGIDKLEAAILHALGYIETGEAVFSARARQIAALREAAAAMDQALDAPGLELVAEQLRLAQQSLGKITGEYTSDDLLGEIFGRFCIGK